MEGIKSVSESRALELLIDEYEAYSGELSKEKKEEILDLLKNHNQLKSKEEIFGISEFLHFAFEEEDIDLIKILICETIKDDFTGLTFKIDKINKTASLTGMNRKLIDIIIPRTIHHKLNDYLVTSISIWFYGDDDFNTLNKTIKFEENSAVRTIYKNSFACTNIEEIYFPDSLIELRDGWCYRTNKLKKIIVSPSNGQFVFKDDKCLLGKSDSKSDEFDILLFVRRDIKEISIPSNIKIIKPFSFQFSSINEIFIPASVTKICSDAFSHCRLLKKVEIPMNSNLKIIEKEAFHAAGIEEISFPDGLFELEDGWCYRINKLKKIIVSPSNGQFVYKDDKYLLGKSDLNSDEFDILLFARRDIKDISIPSNIKIINPFSFQFSSINEIFIPASVTKISDNAFSNSEFRKVTFPINSNLKIIGKKSFSDLNIEEISIPASVTKICENAFQYCRYLRKVEIPMNSNLQTIENSAFSDTGIEEISIPASVTKICENAFHDCESLRKVEIPMNSNLQTIENSAFESTMIEEISIPASVTKICSYAFHDCESLRKVEIPMNSNLQTIESSAFESTIIEEISIPASVTKICENAFVFCEDLAKIEIPTNSNLKTIERGAFYATNIEEIYFPDSLIELEEGWCSRTNKLKKIILSPSNGQFVYKDGKYLLGKSDSNSDEFDILLFARRDIEEISIPANVTKICKNAFELCENLKKVEIPTNSILQTIESKAFSESNIEEIFIPASVTKICSNAFSCCSNLKIVEIPTNSILQTIDRNVFREIKIEKISIPASVTKICSYAFHGCKNLTKIEIPTDSKLKAIESDAFSESNIEEISFPEGLIELEEGWCSRTNKLKKIIVSPSNGQFVFKDDKYLLGKSDSNSDLFDILLFVRHDIKEIFIPASVTKICDNAFSNCGFRKVTFPINSNLKIIGKNLFSNSKIEEISIPASVTKICSNAFQYCRNLRKVEIPMNSNLQTIENSAFSETGIKEIFIPASVTKICKNAFELCKNLKKVEIPMNSNLQTIEYSAFSDTGIKGIFIPASVTKICSNAFENCDRLIVEISEDSRLHLISDLAFGHFPRPIIMVPPSSKQLVHVLKTFEYP